MLTKKCIRCRKTIIKRPSESMQYWKTKRFCSYRCASIGRPNPNKGKPCPHMIGNKFRVGLTSWNKGLTTKNSKKVAEYGKKSGDSRKNKPRKPFVIINGYKCIFMPHHPRACKFTKTIPEQILVMEKHLGRFLTKVEVVHHIDSNKLNNELYNLQLFPNKSEHMRWHTFNDPKNGLKKRWDNPGFSIESRAKISKSLKHYYKVTPNAHWTKRN